MVLFARAHRLGPAALLSTALALAGWWLAGTTLPVPQLLQGGMHPVAVELLLATGFAPIIGYVLPGPTLRFEHAARRRLLAADALLVAALLAPVALVGLAGFLLGDPHVALLGLRNAAGFLGLALAVRAVADDVAAAAVPVGYFLLVAMLGGRPGGQAAWWAVFRAQASGWSLAVGLGVLCAGAVLFHRQGRRQASRRGA